ncbi:MAG: hypothetical protein ACRDK2_05740 [Solirubrobacteraceae bacterium]
MNIWVALVTLLLLAVVIFLVSSPLRVLHTHSPQASERADLEAAREAKYREIRDAELDYRTGKLSREDFQAIDRVLRGEAVEILERLGLEEPEQRE